MESKKCSSNSIFVNCTQYCLFNDPLEGNNPNTKVHFPNLIHAIKLLTMKLLLTIVLLIFFSSPLLMAQESFAWKVKISVASELQSSFNKGGRLLLRFSGQSKTEPRQGAAFTVGFTDQLWTGDDTLVIESTAKGLLSSGSFPGKPTVYAQVVYKNNLDDAQENVGGNWFSNVDSIPTGTRNTYHLTLAKVIPPTVMADYKFAKLIEIKSKCLSEFSGHTRTLKASVLLPTTYFDNPGKSYPICYRAPGLNGRYTFIENKLKDKEFMDWWHSGKAPQVIYVFLDSRGPYGDTYQVDSENNGPCGKALTEELIPAIEQMVHYQPSSHQRYLAGLSTGGWVALGLQLFYPDFFDGAWSYSPDPVDFEHYGLINIYNDESVFVNRYGFPQPGVRTVYGEPTRSMKDWIQGENLISRSGNYLVSGGQFGAYNAVFGPKGKDGLPSLMFDPWNGKVDHEVAKQWEKYDLKKVLEKNWSTLGPKLQGKIWIWTGDMDDLYSNVATRFLKTFLDKTENPKSDAVIRFTPMAGHCEEFSDDDVIRMVGKKALGSEGN